MSIRNYMFGPSKAEIWSQVAQAVGGDYVNKGLLGCDDQIRCQSGQWEIVLDNFAVATGQVTVVGTRMRAPFINKDGLYFHIYPEGLFNKVGKFFGSQDIQVDDPVFDDKFMIKGNDEAKVKQLLSSEKIKSLLQSLPEVDFQISGDEGLFGNKFPDGVDMLHFTYLGDGKDPQILKDLFELFSCVLERLVEIDSAYESDPNVTL